MDFATRNWFNYVDQNIRLDEGIKDLGLSEQVITYIESALHDAPESAKTWMGHRWKHTHLHQFVRPSNRIQEFRFNTMEPLLSALDYWTGGTKKEDLDEPEPKVQFEARPPWGWGPIAEAHAANLGLRRRLTEEETEAEMEARVTKRTGDLVDRAKNVKFVLQTINKTIKDLPLGKWNKAFKKAVKRLTKLGLNDKTTGFVKEVLDNAIENAWKQFQARFQDTFTFLNMHPDNIRIISDIDNMADADSKAEEEIAEQEDPDQILHTFADGSYWYDLETSNCDLEGERMGHCGSAQSGGTMYSLRKPEGKRGKSKSYVTIEADGDTVFQIKGRSNSVPPNIMWPHIEWFIENMNIQEVTEQGEHSDDPEAFEEMNHYLDKNTDANFSGNRQVRVDELENELDNVDHGADLDHSEVYYNISDYGEDDNQIYVDVGAECSLQINLGWPMFFQTKMGYTAMDKDGNPITSYPIIPTTYTEQNAFEGDVGIDEVAGSLPGEEAQIEISMKMLQGAIPDDWDNDEEYPETAHLIVEIRRQETIEDTERQGGSSAASDYEYFASEVVSEFEEKYGEHVKTIQRKLAVEGYITKNAYVKDMSKLEKISELKHWKVHVDDENAQFTFLGDQDDEVVYRLRTGLALPTETMIYLTGGGTQSAEIDLIRRMFPNLNWRGGGELRGQSLNSQMAHNLQGAYKEAQAAVRAASDQEELDFGDKYAPDPIMELAEDIELIIYPNIKRDVREPERVPTLTFDFTFLVRVSYDDDVEEIDRVLAMLHYVNDNPMIPRNAVQEILAPAMSQMETVVWATKKKLEMSNTVTSFFQQMDSTYGAAAARGDDDDAERRMLIAMWLRDNWEQMDLLERFVANSVYIKPMMDRTFRIHGANGAIDVDTGEPRNWSSLVQKERVRRGVGLASGPSPVAPVNESIEDQITRIDNLLNEKVSPIDLRIYRTRIGCSIDSAIAGAEMEIETQIRGIDGVTTVRSIVDSKRPLTATSNYATYEIKFELMGADSRKEYREAVLFPGLRRIPGINIIDWSSIHRTNVRGTTRTVREDKMLKEYGIGGPVGLSAMRRASGARATPTPQLDVIISDWAEGGVQLYDTPTNFADMSSHLMMPVEELLPLRSAHYRGDMNDFRGRYQNFIREGASAPVFLAIGQNGRAKITGNEDLIWFAQKAGLEELPVFISYQKQA
jgi:hypothetical protein